MKRTTDALVALLLGIDAPAIAEPLAVTVTASAETEGTRGDADDPAIWVDPADPSKSLIFGTDKTAGLYVYGLDGAVRQFLPDGELNNVDVRPFTMDGLQVGLVGATWRDDDTIVLYIVEDGVVRPAVPWQHTAIPPDTPEADDIYGFTFGRDANGIYAIANFKSGHIAQWRVQETQGTLALEHVRTLHVPSQPEGMVADDRAGHLYVGEEDRGIWRFPLSPQSGVEGQLIAAIPSDCLPRDDVEGLAIFDGPTRYLVASAQGVHRAALFQLNGAEEPVCQALVEITVGIVDGVTETDGLDVTASPVGSDYPGGLLVMMDDQNAGFTTNFKFISWDVVAAPLQP